MKRMFRILGVAVILAVIAIGFAGCGGGGDEPPPPPPPFMEMVQIPAGSFTRGIYEITLSAFKMGKYEVTQEQYQTLIGVNGGSPSSFSSDPADGEVQGKRPVENVTWYDAVLFCNLLSLSEGLDHVYSLSERIPSYGGHPITSMTVVADWTKNGYRLPTEAQWEYACRAGKTTNYYWGNSTELSVAGEYAWYSYNSGGKTHQVGKKSPNAFGLYDMSGNVWEWCWDWYEPSYPNGAQSNPKGAESSEFGRVLRGGHWINTVENLQSAHRNVRNPSNRDDSVGFRVVRP